MNFNYNAFILGALTITAIYGSNVFYCVLCRLYNIRIMEFSVFFTSGFSIHRAKVAGIDFSLGWLPLGSYIKPLGMAANAEERSQIAPEDQPYAFFNKPGYLRVVFLLVSPVTIVVLFLATYIIGITTSAVPPMGALFNYIIDGARAMFTSQVSHEAFAAQTQQILQGNSAVMIAFLILLVVFLVINIGPVVSQMLPSTDGEVTGARRIVMMVAMIVFMWLALWKIPMFIFSFFSWQQNFMYVTDFLLGLLIAGVAAYFLTIAAVRVFARQQV
ncbi:hypothetical protein [Parachryseolinea silvisoli]|uniref:hypothetical protein n=1 Tax=Parachryseolinea silvisoli TaxID=2873601 RepID=UPI002265EA3A|nr:hypothetical protein [Parachryseolinea silvisoli]MCD9014228.1 hypothetical protein [Parachryseolinea silvisoli]